MIETVHPIFEKIRPFVIRLTAEERLSLIEAIATLDSPPQPNIASRQQRQQRLKAEQQRWFKRPAVERQPYQGQFVALQNGQVIDHDADQRALTLRVRQAHALSPIAIIQADWTEIPTLR